MFFWGRDNSGLKFVQLKQLLAVLVDKLRGAGLLTDLGAEGPGSRLAAARMGGGDNGGIQTIKDHEVAIGVVHGRKSGDALDVKERREHVHLVVVDLVPGDVPAGPVLVDAVLQFECAEVVADAVDTGHQR